MDLLRFRCSDPPILGSLLLRDWGGVKRDQAGSQPADSGSLSRILSMVRGAEPS
jgi:hypothetical protein